MTSRNTRIGIAAFEEERGADEVLRELKQAKGAGVVGIQNAAVLRQDKKSKLHIKETGGWGGGKGAAAGAVLGGFVGLVAGPVGWLGLTGAVIGGLAAKLRDSGFSNARPGRQVASTQSTFLASVQQPFIKEDRICLVVQE